MTNTDSRIVKTETTLIGHEGGCIILKAHSYNFVDEIHDKSKRFIIVIRHQRKCPYQTKLIKNMRIQLASTWMQGDTTPHPF